MHNGVHAAAHDHTQDHTQNDLARLSDSDSVCSLSPAASELSTGPSHSINASCRRHTRGCRAGRRSRLTKSSRLREHNLMLAHWNVRGVRSKLAEIENISERHDILLLQETLIGEHHSYELDGFSIHRCNDGRGALIAVRCRPGLTWNVIDCSQLESPNYLIQGICVADSRLSQPLNIFNLYVSDCPRAEDWTFLERIAQMPGESIISGDFNARSPTWCVSGRHNANGTALEEFFLGSCLQLISTPTATTATRRAERHGDSDTTIDLILCSPSLADSASWSPAYHGASDHLLCELRLKTDHPQPARPAAKPQLYRRVGRGSADVFSVLRRKARRRRGTSTTGSMPSRKQWWTPELDRLWQEKRAALKAWRRNKSSDDSTVRECAKSHRNRTNAEWKRCAATAKRKCWDHFLSKAYANAQLFWRFVHSLDGFSLAVSDLQIYVGPTLLRSDEDWVLRSSGASRISVRVATMTIVWKQSKP